MNYHGNQIMKNIYKLISIKNKNKLQTAIVITMATRQWQLNGCHEQYYKLFINLAVDR